MLPRVHEFSTQALLVEALTSRIAALANACLEQHGYFSIVLAGGTTPRTLYQHLRFLSTDWRRWHIYFGDERYLPVGDPQRNDSMAAAAWLDHVPIPPAQVHRVPSANNVAAAAHSYASILEQAPGFDLALLGLGEDGHTASLFPGDNAAINNAALAVAIADAPKPPPQRVSMSPVCLGRAAAVYFVVTGDSKRQALRDWLAGVQLPPQAIKPPNGIDIFTDIVDSCC
jgi:6-phosphogluconolactonase